MDDMFAMRKFAMAIIGSALVAVAGAGGLALVAAPSATVVASPQCPDDMHWCPGGEAPESATDPSDGGIDDDDMHW
ncbi:MAG TPA: hypothetical protein VFV67_22400 [Actinophytocola sp.]|uniref:hypothetical protein n=1 Tax=Actinophytocola sp. TaxID=1872138 RepID=UPI002DBAA6D5|nr:hypothetical protein [Actinophytocola sp.]HEU5473404.1 hypothetical protein [Actinophytocola sp.]